MTIETKYDIGQSVWVMLRIATDNVMEAKKVDCRDIQSITRTFDGRTIYHLEAYRGAFRRDYFEEEVFDSEPGLVIADPPSCFELVNKYF